MAFKNLMARGEERGEEVAERSAEITPQPPVRPQKSAPPPSCIGASCEFSGEIHSPETIRIEGRVKGEVHCEQTVIVEESASIEAAIHAASVLIAGEVRGDMSATKKITLQKTARVTGDLCTPGIVIEEGAKLEGRIVISPDEQPSAAKKPEARPAAQPSESAAAPTSQGTAPPRA
jgi:cytoskeletal protein CcmA (bactofilin family)